MTEGFVPKTSFLENPDLSDGKAATILDTLKAVLAEKRFPHPVLSKVLQLASDGAAGDRRERWSQWGNEKGKPNDCKCALSCTSTCSLY